MIRSGLPYVLVLCIVLLPACSGEDDDPAPVLSGLSPLSGPEAGGTSVTLSGSDFQDGAAVFFGGTEAANVGYQDASTLTCDTPAHAAGTVEVKVRNPDGQESIRVDAYTYVPAPAVSGIAPDHGFVSGGTAVTITGTDFQSGATVTFGGTAATSVNFVSATSITCNTPAHAAGTVDVVVTNPDSQTGTLSGGFTFDPAPALSSVSPSSGPSAGGTPVTLTGTDFVSGATVTFGAAAATGVTVVSSTSITCTTPAGSDGAVDVVVTNPDTQLGTLTNGYTYFAPLSVTNSNPVNGQSNVNLNAPIVLTFNLNVDPTTVSPFSVRILDPQGQSPAGTYAVSTNTVTFTPQYPPGYAAMTTYTIVMDAPPASPTILSSSGGPLVSPYTATFTTGSSVTPDTTGPTVVSITPTNAATAVSRDTNILITFSEPIDASTAPAGFSLAAQAAPGTPLNGTLTLESNSTVLRFDPEPTGIFPDYLSSSTGYLVQLNSFIRDNAGNPLQGAPWASSFTTGTTPSAASAQGPITENFTDNTQEEASQSTAEWNTAVPGSVVTQVQAQPITEADPGPSSDPTSAIQGPFETAAYRTAFLVQSSWFAQPLAQLSGKPITRLYWKHSGTLTSATYSDLIVRIGHTTLTAFPSSPSSFSSLYMQGTTQVDPQVVARSSSYSASVTTGPGGGYVEIPMVGNFVYNGTDNIIIDIEVSGGTAQNLLSGDDQSTAGSPVLCRAYDSTGTYDSVQGTDTNAQYFMIEFGGHPGTAGLDGAGNSLTTLSAPLGTGNDIFVYFNATLDTSLASNGYGHLKVNSVYVAPGAVLSIIGPNPCVIRASRSVRIEGTIRASGLPGSVQASLAGGLGGTGGPCGGPGGTGGAGTISGSGSAGLAGWGLDAQTAQAQGAGQGGGGGAGGAGGGGGACAVAGSQGLNSGAAMGGTGGLVWGSTTSLFLQGGAGGGGGGGGSGSSSGGGGGGGGGGYLQITCDRNITIGPNAVIEARGGFGGSAAPLSTGGGAGGGAGGAVFFSGLGLTFTGSGGTLFNVQGGAGGPASAGGGSGAPITSSPYNHLLSDGRIRIDAAVTNLSNATFVPSATTQAGPTLTGAYLSMGTSTAFSKFYDTGCSAPQYQTAVITYTAGASPSTSVAVNFFAADPDILSQPTMGNLQLYPTAEVLPVGSTTATVTLGGTQAGYVNGSPASQTGTSLDGLRFIRFQVDLFTTSSTVTPQVSQITLSYQH